MITLTVNEIYDLARFAGLPLDESQKPDEDEGETTYSVGRCPEKGLLDDDGSMKRYRLIAWLEEYPEEGYLGLGDEISGLNDQSSPTAADGNGGAERKA